MAASVSLPVGVAEAAPTRTGAEQQAEARMFDQHNRARAKSSDFGYGGETSQKTLRWAEDLAEVARDWSDTMARTGKFRHNPDLATQACCWGSVGENIAYAGPCPTSAAPLRRPITSCRRGWTRPVTAATS
jgi:uncharacterized protein YkwD